MAGTKGRGQIVGSLVGSWKLRTGGEKREEKRQKGKGNRNGETLNIIFLSS